MEFRESTSARRDRRRKASPYGGAIYWLQLLVCLSPRFLHGMQLVECFIAGWWSVRGVHSCISPEGPSDPVRYCTSESFSGASGVVEVGVVGPVLGHGLVHCVTFINARHCNVAESSDASSVRVHEIIPSGLIGVPIRSTPYISRCASYDEDVLGPFL